MGDLQKDVKIRRRIESIYNKDQQDFPDLKSFGDYEEEKEDIIFNLCQGIDVGAMEAKIAAYQKMHHEEILITEARKAESQRLRLEGGNGRANVGNSQVQASAEPENIEIKDDAAFMPTTVWQPSLPPPPEAVCQEEQTAANPQGRMTSEKIERMGLVSGWHPDMPRKRTLEEAYSTIFAS